MRTFRNLISCLSIVGFIVVFCSTGKAQDASLQEALILRFRFEGSGNVAVDASGNGNDGEIVGAQRALGRYGKGLAIGRQDEYVQISNVLQPATTVEFWFKPNWDGSDTETYRLFDANTGSIYYMIGKGKTLGDRDTTFGFYLEDASDADFQDWEMAATDAIPAAGEWYHLATTWDFDAGEAKFYINGEEVGSVTGLGSFPPLNANPTIGFNSDAGYMPAANGADGIIDEFAIYAKVLTGEEIQIAMHGVGDYPWAYGPSPKDGSLINDTWVNLSWSAGDFAASHDVYLGDNLDSVNNATVDSPEFRGNQTTAFYVAGFPGYAYPEGLVPGTTYYWRIDEVNDADPNSPWKGPIWSFSIPPKTAYNPDPANNAEGVGPDDVTLSWTPGFGAKLHTVYLGDDYDQVGNATGGTMQGVVTYKPGPLELERVYYWRVDEFDAIDTYKGETWTFTTPGAVSAPQPADNATGVAMTTSLNWTAATNATSHQVYLGLDKEVVRNADTSSPEYQGSATLGSEDIDPGKLAWHTMYYWRVDAVTDAGTVKGPIWSFTIADFIAVDDFESYTDDDTAGEAIWQSWIDGFGVADNGAQVGYLLPPYAEQTIVHGGLQSMPLLYTNEDGVTNSEASLTLTKARDWTEESVAELSLWIRGSSNNAADPMYLAVSNTTGASVIVANEDPTVAQKGSWTQWVIPLQTIADQGINLTDVDKISIGLGSKSGMAVVGGTGTMFIDDIALFRLEP
ncbi:MAG: LamG domain-containing protein [Sedimentisphaerales bacterium]